jgi:uncharacterized membrane protein
VSPWRLRLSTVLLAVLGLAIAGYLSWVHYADLEPICVGGSGGCERVQSSQWADLAGIPVAVLGVAGYAGILLLSALPGEIARTGAAFLALVGAGFSAWLTYVEVAKIDAICQWCVASALVMAALAVVSIFRLLREA